MGIALLAGRAAAATGDPATAPPAPRLIVVIVIDQFRQDFLTRHQDRFGPDGFRRLLRDGARFASCVYPYALTETAPGHATIATGTTPDRHGIVSNEWFDRGLNRMVGAVDDPESPLIGAVEGREGASPRRLLGDTFADELRLATDGRAKCYGVALKARAAVPSVGHSATGAFWYDAASGRFVTSRFYARSLPGWVASFNDGRPADRFYGRDWSPGGQVLVRLKGAAGRPDRAYYEALQSTPYVHDLLFEFARALVERERLGDDPVTDFMFLGLSGHDYLGHDTGPYSEAVGAMTQASDTQIAAFLKFLDGRLGRSGYWLALSADHGVSPTLRQAGERGLRPPSVDKGAVSEKIRRALSGRFAGGSGIRLHGGTTRVWFDAGDLARHKVSARDAALAAGEAASTADGILGYIAPGASNLDAGTLEAYRLSTYAGRSPDLFLVLEPFALVQGASPANHGTPWTYDAHVPLVLHGPPFRPGTYRDRCTPADLAPTLSAALGIPAPAMATGRILSEAFSER